MQNVYSYKPTAVVVIDMIADSDLRLEQEIYSMKSSPSLWKDVTTSAKDVGISFSKYPSSIRDDQHPFAQQGIPSILLIDFGYPHWHTHEDTIDKCSAKSLQKVGQALLNWLEKYDSISSY